MSVGIPRYSRRKEEPLIANIVARSGAWGQSQDRARLGSDRWWGSALTGLGLAGYEGRRM